LPATLGPASRRTSPPGAPTCLDVLVLHQFSMMSLAATIEPLRAANRVSGQELYRWRLVSLGGDLPASSSGVTVGVAGAFAPAEVRDGLFVVAAFDAQAIGRSLASDLRTVARRGLSVAGIEAGAWVLGRAGLLDGYRATTHWEDLEEFAATFPKVEVVSDRFVMDRTRWTAGGAAPALDMMLAMISAEHGLPLALNVASIFIYEQAQASSAPQPIVSLGRLAAADPALASVIGVMQRNLEEPVPVPRLAAGAGLLTRTLQTRFRAQLGMSPHAYYLDLRLAAAKRMLQHSGHNVAEVASAYGFGSASAFARAFRARFGMSPVEAREQGGGSWALRPATVAPASRGSDGE
jgi:AraC family transcriptional regulator, glycine betaine-responsive activator